MFDRGTVPRPRAKIAEGRETNHDLAVAGDHSWIMLLDARLPPVESVGNSCGLVAENGGRRPDDVIVDVCDLRQVPFHSLSDSHSSSIWMLLGLAPGRAYL